MLYSPPQIAHYMTVLSLERSWNPLRFPWSSLAIFSIFLTSANAEGNVTCAGSGLDWYKTSVGETPCKTYERLRQICNPHFEVGIMNITLPPDSCNEQLSNCCCNSIAFALSMLCLNCQQNIGNSSGLDAGNGVYQKYLQGNLPSGTCSPVQNQRLPPDIQSAVCNSDIKIFNDLYGLFWVPGAWFYMYTFETISKNISSTNNNDFFNCTSTTVNAPNPVTAVTVESTVTITQAPLPISTQATSNLNNDVTSSQPRLSRAAIGGIVAGVVGGLVVLVVLGFLVWNRKRPISSMIKPFRDFGSNTNTDVSKRGDGAGAYARPVEMRRPEKLRTFVEQRTPGPYRDGRRLVPKKLLDNGVPRIY